MYIPQELRRKLNAFVAGVIAVASSFIGYFRSLAIHLWQALPRSINFGTVTDRPRLSTQASEDYLRRQLKRETPRTTSIYRRCPSC